MKLRDALNSDMFRRKGGSSCLEIGRKIQSYLDSELDDRTAAKVASHLDACRRCGLDATAYRDIKEVLAKRPGPLTADDPIDRLRVFASRLAASGQPPAEPPT